MPSLALAQETVSATAEGESEISYEVAKEKALRNAVREAVGVVLASETRVADFRLICDAIYSRAAGYVRSHKVLEQKRGMDDTYRVKIHAEVVRGKINDDFLAVKNLIEYMGRPQFVVTVEERSGSEQGIGVWTEGAINDHLETTGFSALHVQTTNEAVQREYMRAVVSGDAAKAQQLRLQMGAPYGVSVIAFGKKSRETVYGRTVNLYTAEIQISVVHRDSGDLIASKSVTGQVSNEDVSGMQTACKRAVAEVFPEALDRILSHWCEDIDRGIALTVQLYAASYRAASSLADKIKTLRDVRSVEIVEAPEGGIANIRVIGMVKARDIADRIPSWTDNEYQANLEGPRIVTARPVASLPSATATDSGPSALVPAKARPNYLLPAVILGGCILLGVVLAAVILRKK